VSVTERRRLISLALVLIKLYYNVAITGASVLMAVVVGVGRAAGVIGSRFELGGPVWDRVASVNAHFGWVGYAAIVFFALVWLEALFIARGKPASASEC